MGVLVSRYTGMNDHDKVNRAVYQAFLMSIVLGLGPSARSAGDPPKLLNLVHASRYAAALCTLRTMSVHRQLLYYMIAGALRRG